MSKLMEAYFAQSSKGDVEAASYKCYIDYSDYSDGPETGEDD